MQLMSFNDLMFFNIIKVATTDCKIFLENELRKIDFPLIHSFKICGNVLTESEKKLAIDFDWIVIKQKLLNREVIQMTDSQKYELDNANLKMEELTKSLDISIYLQQIIQASIDSTRKRFIPINDFIIYINNIGISMAYNSNYDDVENYPVYRAIMLTSFLKFFSTCFLATKSIRNLSLISANKFDELIFEGTESDQKHQKCEIWIKNNKNEYELVSTISKSDYEIDQIKKAKKPRIYTKVKSKKRWYLNFIYIYSIGIVLLIILVISIKKSLEK
ncbi:hypothetical protein NUSPORA_00417 [Nucleospora cyclopteri]